MSSWTSPTRSASDVFLSVNVGSGTVQEAADWLEYLTADKPTSLAKERAANGHPAPYKIKYLGLGNENWGCGGAMSPDHYVEEMKRYAHYFRNLNPSQTGANAMKRVAVGWDSGNSDYTEAVMKAWKDKTWSWDIEGVSLHGYTIPNSWEKKGPSVGFGEDEYAKGIKATLQMKGLDRQTDGNHGPLRSREEGRALRRRVGHLGRRRTPAATQAFFSSRIRFGTQLSRRSISISSCATRTGFEVQTSRR